MLGTLAGIAVVHHAISCIQPECLYISFHFISFVALQKRQLDCVMDNGTLLDAILCSDRDRPSQKRECFNENCRGAWKVSDWSHVSHDSFFPNFSLSFTFINRPRKSLVVVVVVVVDLFMPGQQQQQQQQQRVTVSISNTKGVVRSCIMQ